MRIFRDISSINIENPVATIGIFDGVHRAHQEILAILKSEAAKYNGESTVITLWPHPRIVLNKDIDSLRLINTLEEKIDRLEKSGIDNLIILPFDQQMAGTDFANFVREILVEKIGIKQLVVGFNHQFGKNREGNFTALKDLARNHNFSLTQVEPFIVDNEKVSSSKIRMFIQTGNISRANSMLGYNFSITGKVVEGNKIGRSLGFPTANITLNNPIKLLPKNGVYAVLVTIDDKNFPGMMNIGNRPTIQTDTKQAIPEVHLFDFDRDIYGYQIRVDIIERMRDEKKFDSKKELIAQIKEDQLLIKDLLSLHKK